MALTVTKSRQLGFSMEALSGIQDNILNFESSIQAELEAELLTGKELNLEKARYYALTNQQFKLQDEIVRQVGTLNEYEKMNVFQQKAYAQALGMSAPKVACLTASESVSTAMPLTEEAAWLAEQDFGSALVGGPFAFDNAVSEEAARIKGIDHPVAGQADVLVVPNIECGNILFKSMVYLRGATAAGLVLGAKVPVIVTSRADPPAARLASVALAAIVSNHTA